VDKNIQNLGDLTLSFKEGGGIKMTYPQKGFSTKRHNTSNSGFSWWADNTNTELVWYSLY